MAQTATVCASLLPADVGHLLQLLQGVVQCHEDGRDALLGLLQEVLEIQQGGLVLVFVDERRGNASLAAAARSTNPMHVVLDLARHVVVDDVLNVGEIQTLGSHIRGDKHVLLPPLECIDGLKALLLSFVAMDGNGLHTLAKEVLVDDVDIHLVFREDQHRRGGLLQAFQQVDDLRLLFHVLYFLDDIQVGGAGAADVDGDGLDKRTLCKCPDLHGHGRAEHQRLPLAAKVTQDLSDILLKAKVHHSVSLIQAKIPAAVQRHALLVQQVLQAPGSGHDDVAPAAQDVCLRADVDAADG
mmetsp:Transcript_40503/g.103728  ORF Transcript_40503/g.103728 Transcript_40503/m.103728 type:complete len:298 (-) Transcript_40503:1225-2118(-)